MEPTEVLDEDVPLIIRAREHYGQYMRATDRDARPFTDIAERLLRKPPQSDVGRPAKAKRKA